MQIAHSLLDRIDAYGRRVPLTAAVPLAGLYLATMALYALGFASTGELVLVVAPAWLCSPARRDPDRTRAGHLPRIGLTASM